MPPAQDPSPVPFTALGACAAGTVLVRIAGKLHVSAVLKATFSLVPGAAMRMLPPEPLLKGELHHQGNPTHSVRATSDLVAYLPRVDVVLTGHACAPAGQTVKRAVVRLALYHGHAVLDKTLHVQGDRSGQDITPFDKMPLVYERALGGIGFKENPYGTGLDADSKPPNIVHPSDPKAVAGFGPLSRALPARRALLGKIPSKVLTQPVPDLPAEIDWAYFQSAPADQQIPSLVGNEWVVLEGMHPTEARLSSRLPSTRGLVALYGMDPNQPDAARNLTLRPDLLRIDADTLQCSLAFRTVIPLEDERALASIRLVGGVDTEDAHIQMPATPPQRASVRAAHVSASTAEAPGDEAATIALDGGKKHDETVFGVTPAAHQSALPFLPSYEGPRTPASPIAGAPWSGIVASRSPAPNDGDANDFTLELGAKTAAKPAMPPMPPPLLMPSPMPTPAPLPMSPMPPAPAQTTESADPPKAPKPIEIVAERPAKAWSYAEPPPPPPEAPKPAPPPRPAVNKSVYGTFGPPKKKV